MKDWWQARQPRERTMLAAMAVAIAAFLYVYAAWVPLAHLRDVAHARYDRAAADAVAVQADLAAIAAARSARPAPPAAEAFAGVVLDAARQAGVPVTRQRATTHGSLELGIDAVDAPVLFAWLDRLRQDHGIAPASLHVTARDGALRVEVAFSTAAP